MAAVSINKQEHSFQFRRQIARKVFHKLWIILRKYAYRSTGTVSLRTP
jgi:hypothetical protein